MMTALSPPPDPDNARRWRESRSALDRIEAATAALLAALTRPKEDEER